MRFYLWIAMIWLVCPWLTPAGGQTSRTAQKIAKILAFRPIDAKSEDVEGLFGPPLSKSPDFYKLDELNLLVSYNRGAPCNSDCGNGDNYCGWNVPDQTLITLTIIIKTPFHQKELKKLGINLDQYKQENAEHTPGVISYTSDEHGSAIIVNGNHVESISVFPARKYLHLMCPKSKASIQSIPTFERYGNISSSMEKAILDNFAIQLLRNKDLRGYVVVYVDRATKRIEAQRRIRHIKKYLTDVRDVPAKRIISKDGGRREEAGVELYLVPLGKPGPNVEKKSSSASHSPAFSAVEKSALAFEPL